MSKKKFQDVRLECASELPVLVWLLLLTAFLTSACGGGSPPMATAGTPPPLDPWKEAALKIEEDRGEPVGRKAVVEVPAELKHYRDRRRFLGIQVAESLQQGYEVPQDYADLARMIGQDRLVELDPLGNDYILYGVGESETDGPLTHYDRGSRLSVPLFATDAEYHEETRKMKDRIVQLEETLKERRAELKRTSKRDRRRRAEISRAISRTRGSLVYETRRVELLQSFRSSSNLRRLLGREYESLARLAADLNGQAYDLSDAVARRDFKVRLLSFIRPESRTVLMELARGYKEKFGRRLPVTSLVRTEEYQRRLGETNSNAARNSTPPHTTGLAFDVYYYFMTAEEQGYLMGEIARLKSSGLVEALRERRNHIHVFAFPEGHPPDESLIAEAIPGKRRSKVSSGQASRRNVPGRHASARGVSAKDAATRDAPAKGVSGRRVSQGRGSGH